MTTRPEDTLKEIKNLTRQGETGPAWSLLKRVSLPDDDFSRQHRYTKLFHALSPALPDLEPIRIALVGTSTIDHLAEVFRFWLARAGFSAQLHLATFNTLDQTLLDPESDLYRFKPDIVWILTGHRDIPHAPCGCKEACRAAEEATERFATLWSAIHANSSAYILQNNADIPSERVFGNFEGCVDWGRVNFLRRFNLALADKLRPGVGLLDLDHLSAHFGKRHWFDERFWYHSKHAFSLDAIGTVAFQAASIVQGIKGKAKKCLVLDLDNTLWGGVIGDDGMEGIRLGNGADGEAFVDFQRYVLALKQRGVVLAVCSKNEEDIAKQPFLSHPDMQLKLEDIAVFVANWNDKAGNIRHIANVLELGLDSFVFVDDNPAERELVSSMLPQVEVVPMPEDPALYVRALDQWRLFETVAFSQEDTARGTMYRENALRKNLQASHNNISDFLKSLSMEACCSELDALHLPRVAQLINKSNQFHLTTTRYSEAQIVEMARSPDVTIRFLKLRDKFGDNGLIAVFILKQAGPDTFHVDTWVMSCRVLSRGMEAFTHNAMVRLVRERNGRYLVGKYLPTKKNALVSRLYEKLGYARTGGDENCEVWQFDTASDNALLEHHIAEIAPY